METIIILDVAASGDIIATVETFDKRETYNLGTESSRLFSFLNYPEYQGARIFTE